MLYQFASKLREVRSSISGVNIGSLAMLTLAGAVLSISFFSAEAHAQQADPAPHPLMVITDEAACRVKAEPRPPGNAANLPGQKEKLRIYLKKDGQLIDRPYAELTPDEGSSISHPYLVTAGSILDEPVGCRSLVGKVAIAESADPIWKAKGKSTAAEPTGNSKPLNGNSQPVAPIEFSQTAPAVTQGPQTQEPKPAGASAPPPTVVATAPTAVRGPTLKPRFGLELGFTLAYGRYEGLYIDTNTGIDLSMAGPVAMLKVFPLRLWKGAQYSSAFSPIGMSAEFEVLESIRNLKITRDGQSIGSQETVVTRFNIGFDYALTYWDDRHESRIFLMAWETLDLRNSARFDAGTGGKGSSLRDIEVNCSAVGFSQAYLLHNGHRIALEAGTCVFVKATTPIIGDADITNSKTSFSNSQSIRAKLTVDWNLLSDNALRLGTSLDFSRWVGALELDDGQIIDSNSTVIRAITTLKASL